MLDNALLAASKEPSIERFVFTSSSTAAYQGRENKVFDLTIHSWNQAAVTQAWAPPPYDLSRALATYSSAKVQAEQSLWKYVEEKNPHLEVNAVLPDFVLAMPPNVAKQGFASTADILRQLLTGSREAWRSFYPQYCVDGVDTALLHIAGLVHPEVVGEGIFAYAHPKTNTGFIKRLERLYSDRAFPGTSTVTAAEGVGARWLTSLPDPPPDEGQDLSNIIGRGRAEELLEWMGRPGWKPLDENLKGVCDTILQYT